MRRIFLLLMIAVFLISSGCLETNKNYSCCLRTNATEQDPPVCVMFNSSDPNNPIDMSGVTNWCNTTAQVCNITSVPAGFKKINFIITPTPEEYSLVPICTEAKDVQCIDPQCRAMVCGDFEYRPKVPPYVGDVEKAVPPKNQESGAINLYHGQCVFLPMDYKLANVMTQTSSYLSRFRIGLGSSFDEYADYSVFFPVSDKYCNINPIGTVDRYQNYLINEGKKYDPITEINRSCVSDQDPAYAPLPFKLGDLNLGPDGQPVTGYKVANFIREVNFYGDANQYYMSPYTRPDPVFYTQELRKRYMGDAYNYTEWVIRFNQKLTDANLTPPYLDKVCQPCEGLCDQVKACFDAPIYDAYCKNEWARYDDYLTKKDAAEKEANKTLGTKPPAAPKAIYECDPYNPTICLSGKCSTEHYSRVNLFVRGDEVALPCSHYKVRAVNYSGINETWGLLQDVKVLWTTVLETSTVVPYESIDVLDCEPVTSISFDTPGSSVVTKHLAQADYKSAPGSDEYTQGDAQDIVLFSFDTARYPADHTRIETDEQTGKTCYGYDCAGMCSGKQCNGVYGAGYVANGETILGYAVMRGEDFPKTMLARLCELNASTDYTVVEVSNATVCGRDNSAPPGACLIAKDTLPSSPIGSPQCYNYENCVDQDGNNWGVNSFFFDPNCYIYNEGSCWRTDVSPNLADQYFGLSRTFGESPLYNGSAQGWSDFPKEIMPQFIKDLMDTHLRNGENNTDSNMAVNRYMCLAPGSHTGDPRFDESADCLADLPNVPKEIVLIKGLGICDYTMSPGPFPKIKEYGWCESCSLATMAYQTVQRRDVPYIPLFDVRYESIDGEAHLFNLNGKNGPMVFNLSQVNGASNLTRICSWVSGSQEGDAGHMNCNSSMDLEPYHNQNPGNINAPVEEPEASYLKQQMSRFLQSGVIPILDLRSSSDWQVSDSMVTTTQHVPGKRDCTASERSQLLIDYADGQCNESTDKTQCVNDAVNAECGYDQQVTKAVEENLATRLVNNMGAIIVVVESTERADAQTMRDNIKQRSQMIKKECPRCLTAVKITGYDNMTFQNNAYRVFNGVNCFGGLSGPGGNCDMLIADDPLFGVDMLVFDYGVQNNSDAYKNATTAKEKADAVVSDIQSWSYYLLINYRKPSIIYDFNVEQKDPSGASTDAKAWTTDEVGQLFNQMITRENDLVKSGLTGIFYARVTTPATDNWTKLVSTPDLSKHQAMCSLSEAMVRMVADKPMTFFSRLYPSPNVTCVACSFSEMYMDTCNKTCANGVDCIVAGGTSALQNVKCPDDTIAEPCTPCNETGKTYVCTVEYDNGTIATQNIDSSDITSDSYADVMAGIGAPNKCCLSKDNATYSYTQQSLTLPVNAPIVFSKAGDTKVDCSFPSASNTNSEDSQFCNVRSGATNYRVSCVEKSAYAKLSDSGAFKNGYDFSINYNLVSQGTGGLPVSQINGAQAGTSVKVGGMVVSAGGALQNFADPCLAGGAYGSTGTGGGIYAITNASIGGSQPGYQLGMGSLGGNGSSSDGTGASNNTCQGPKNVCAVFAYAWELAAEKKCADYQTLCESHPWSYADNGVYRFCPNESVIKTNFDNYCANVRKKYGKSALQCEIQCCKKNCTVSICPPDPNHPQQTIPGCTPEGCDNGPCLDRDLSCESTCNGGSGTATAVNPPYPWAPDCVSGCNTNKCGDPCGLWDQCGPK